jgi:hypothetical protein
VRTCQSVAESCLFGKVDFVQASPRDNVGDNDRSDEARMYGPLEKAATVSDAPLWPDSMDEQGPVCLQFVEPEGGRASELLNVVSRESPGLGWEQEPDLVLGWEKDAPYHVRDPVPYYPRVGNPDPWESEREDDHVDDPIRCNPEACSDGCEDRAAGDSGPSSTPNFMPVSDPVHSHPSESEGSQPPELFNQHSREPAGLGWRHDPTLKEECGESILWSPESDDSLPDPVLHDGPSLAEHSPVPYCPPEDIQVLGPFHPVQSCAQHAPRPTGVGMLSVGSDPAAGIEGTEVHLWPAKRSFTLRDRFGGATAAVMRYLLFQDAHVSQLDGTLETAQAEAGKNGSESRTARTSGVESLDTLSVRQQVPQSAATPQVHRPPTDESCGPTPKGAESAAAFDIAQQTDALAKRLAPLFPCDGPLEEYRIPAEATWTAIVFVDTIGRLGGHLTAPLVDRINRFSVAHAAAQASALKTAFSLVTDEQCTLTEAARAERCIAAARLMKALSYVRDTVHFHEQRLTHSDYRTASSSELMKEVFTGELRSLRDHWLEPVTGRLVAHLENMRAFEGSQLPLDRAIRHVQIAECLSPMDDLLQPRDRALRAGWVGYAKLRSTLSDRVTSLVANLATAISEGRYSEAHKSLASYDRDDVAQAGWLNVVLRSLAAHAQEKVAAAKTKVQQLDLSQPSAVQDVGAVVESYTALCSLRGSLYIHFEEMLTQGIIEVRSSVMVAACELVKLANAAAAARDHAQGEDTLRLVERLLIGVYGAMDNPEVSEIAAHIRGVRREFGATPEVELRDAYSEYEPGQGTADLWPTAPGIELDGEGQVGRCKARLSVTGST